MEYKDIINYNDHSLWVTDYNLNIFYWYSYLRRPYFSSEHGLVSSFNMDHILPKTAYSPTFEYLEKPFWLDLEDYATDIWIEESFGADIDNEDSLINYHPSFY